MSYLTKEDLLIVKALRSSKLRQRGLRKRRLDTLFGRVFNGRKSTSTLNRLLADEVLVVTNGMRRSSERKILTHVAPDEPEVMVYLYDRAPLWYSTAVDISFGLKRGP